MRSQLSAKSFPRVGHIGHAQVFATFKSTSNIAETYTRGVKRRSS